MLGAFVDIVANVVVVENGFRRPVADLVGLAWLNDLPIFAECGKINKRRGHTVGAAA